MVDNLPLPHGRLARPSRCKGGWSMTTNATSQQVGRSLARLIATVRKLPQPQRKAKRPRWTNGAGAYAQWEAGRG